MKFSEYFLSFKKINHAKAPFVEGSDAAHQGQGL
jgi:hypothetical protein